MSPAVRANARGFSLVELAVSLSILAVLSASVLISVNIAVERAKLKESSSTAAELERALLTYVEQNWRFPCPDTSGSEIAPGDGEENCTSHSGNVPYKTLGFTEAPLDPWRRPYLYSVDTRLTAGGLTYRYSFCQLLRANSRQINANYLHSLVGSPVSPGANLAYVMLSGGRGDSDLNGSYIDQLKSSGVTRGLVTDDYSGDGISNDVYLSSSLLMLSGRLRCPGTIVSANTLENELIAARLTYQNLGLSVDRVDNEIGDINVQIQMAIVQIVQGSVSVVSAASTLIAATGQVLIGNGAALSAAIAAGVAAAAAVSSITASSIELSEAQSSKSEMEARQITLQSFLTDTQNLCDGAKNRVQTIKGSSSLCIP